MLQKNCRQVGFQRQLHVYVHVATRELFSFTTSPAKFSIIANKLSEFQGSIYIYLPQ